MATVLAADLGGTKILVRLVRTASDGPAQETLFEHRYESGRYPSMNAVLSAFFEAASERGLTATPDSACLAVAGPVTDHGAHQTAKVTNLPWQLASDELQRDFGMARVRLINDFVAVGYGVASLSRHDDVVVYAGEENAEHVAPRVVLGAGTGLGVCQIFYGDRASPLVCASEGGHMDFAAQSDQQYRFQRFLSERYGHVSYDRIVCGSGIRDAFSFFAKETGKEQDEAVQRIAASDNPAAAISAGYSDNALCQAAIGLFFEIYGAMAGNLALLALPFGGVFLAGGIAPKLREQLLSSRFVPCYLDKGRLSYIVKRIPVYLIQDTSTGLTGAAYVAARRP